MATSRTSNRSDHLSEALHNAFTLHASKSFLGLRTGATTLDTITQVEKSVFEFKTYQQVRDDALSVATCIALDLKMERRQFFGICCGNCYDWLLFEFACCFNDQPLVGINTSWNAGVMAHVINLSEIVCIACSAEAVPALQALKPSCPSLMHLIVINSDPIKPLPPCSPHDPLHVFVWNASSRRLQLHHSHPSLPIPTINSRSDTVSTLSCVGMQDFTARKLRGQVPVLDQSDVHSLVFTSGASGAPKGVVVTKHRWYLDNHGGGVMNNHADPAFLSYNSWSHGADRGNIWMSLFIGARVGIGRELGEGCSHQELLCDLAGLQPTCVFAFSYLWSELHAVFNRELESITISQACEILESKTPAGISDNVEQVHDHVLSDFQVALRQQNIAPTLALRVISPPVSFHLGTTAPEATSAVQQLWQSKQTFVKHAAEIIGTKELLLSNWFQRMGGRVLAAVTGGGHTSEEVLSWMQAVFGFKTTEYKEQACIWKNSYGSSEFPGISLNGLVSSSIELELVPIFDEDSNCICNPRDPMNRTGRGEIRVRHKDPSLSVQYYRNPEATAAAFRDGWYYTGDVGEWAVDEHNRFVRKKDDNGVWNKVLVIVDRVKNLCELYVDGDSKWVDASRLELELYMPPPPALCFCNNLNRYHAAPCVRQICLVCDRNQSQMVALLVPSDGELHRWRPSGDSALADESLEQNAEFATHLLQELKHHAASQASSRGRTLHMFELPCAVVVCAQPWTPENGLLTANGKLKRGDLKRRFQKRTEDAYFSAFSSSQTPVQVGSGLQQCLDAALYFPTATAAVIVPSPVFNHDCVTKVAKGRFYMGDEIALCVNDTVNFAGGKLPGGIFNDRVYVVTSKSRGYPHHFEVRECTSSGPLEVAVEDTKVAFSVHRAVSLPAPLSSCIEQLGCLTGTAFVQSRLPAQDLVRGRCKNDTSVLPLLEGSDKELDFIEFEFKGADHATTAQANKLLSRLKELVKTYRQCAEGWIDDANAIKLRAENSEIEQIRAINEQADAKFYKFIWGNEDATAGTGFADDNRSFIDDLESLLIYLCDRVARFKAIREETKRLKSQEPPSKTLFLKEYNVAADTLRVLVPRFGLSIPFEIEHVKWWQARVRDISSSDVELRQGIQNSQASVQNFGEIVVTCCMTGTLIQRNEMGAGKPRYNNLDDDKLQCSVEGYTLAQSVLSFIQNMRVTHHEAADQMYVMVSRCPLFCPFIPDNSISRSWCLEHNSSYHLLQSCFVSHATISLSSDSSHTIGAIKSMIQGEQGFPLEHQSLFHSGTMLADERTLQDYNIKQDGELVLRLRDGQQFFVSLHQRCDIHQVLPSRDTPAGRLYRAFRAFANRPALGIPDAHSMKAHALLSSINFRRSAFSDALRIELTLNRGYRWISFADLGRMASLVAKVLRSAGIPRGSFVAISGYNDIEWAACDFACALSGLVSVGIHSTFNAEEALFALQNSGCVALLTSVDFVLDNRSRGVDKHFWSVQSVFALAKKQQQQMSVTQIFLTDAAVTAASNSSNFAEIDAPVQIHSMVDMLSQPSKFQSVPIEHPDLQPEGGLDSLFTILHTGGSSGRPKQVMVKARAFARDIGAKNFTFVNVTCSYIPLSHSSDRYKLWEVCCCGGSVAFAFYDASHWIDHERLKKNEALETGSLHAADFNNVDSLLRQLQDVAVTAMSCPPNIWTGVFRMYSQWMCKDGLSEQQACERVRQTFGDRLKFIATGGAPTPSDVMAAVSRWFPKASFVDSFGTTECGAISANGKLLVEKGVKVKVCVRGSAPFSGIVSGELLVFSPSMSAGYLNDEARTNESFVQLSREDAAIFPPVSENDEKVKWYATGDLVDVVYDEFACRVESQDDGWAKRINIKGRISAQVKLSSGLSVSPDILEPIYANSRLFADIYIDARSSSSSIVAIVTPAASLKDLTRPDGTPLFDFDAICPKDFFSSVEGFRNEIGSKFYTRRRQFIDAAIAECRSIATGAGLAAHEIPVAFHVDIEPWTVQNRMMNSNLKKNRKMFEQRYATILHSLHAPFLAEAPSPVDSEDKSLKSLACNGESWVVLCTGGSSANHYGTLGRPWKNLHADHSHLSAVNNAFQTLSKLIGRDRIIVIGSFNTHRKFLEDAAQSGFPPFQDKFDTETSKVKWAEKLADFKLEFCDILQHCDYDGEHVNPSTILDVISGRQVHFPTPVAGRVVPYSQGVRSVFFYIHTHGWSYAVPQQRATKCDLCVAMGNSELMLAEQHPKNVGHDHSSLRTREWYLGMPHPGDPHDFGSIVFPAKGKPCLNPFDKRLKSFESQMVAGTFSVSVDGSYPPLYKSHEWKDEKGVVLAQHDISWHAPNDETYPKSKIFNHNRASQPVYMNMLTRSVARSRPDAAQDLMALLPEAWVEFLHYQNCYGTSAWVLNPATSNCALHEFLHDSETASSDAPFLLDFSLWQHFFTGFGRAIQQSPFTKFVVCFDACGSGGLAKFLNDQAYEKHTQVGSWPLAIIASSDEQIYTKPIGTRLFAYLEAALSQPAMSLEATTPISASNVNATMPLRRFFSEVLDTVRQSDKDWDKPAGFGDQGIVMASGSASGIEAAELQSIFYNGVRK